MNNESPIIAIIDVSHIFRSIWHASGDAELNHAFNETVQIIHKIMSNRYHSVACCFDKGPYKRNEVYPQYKANREGKSPEMVDQYKRLAVYVNKNYPSFFCQGYEADDVIASLVADERIRGKFSVDIYTNDKDLMQLVNDADRVSIVSTASGDTYMAGDVFAKFGVVPETMVGFLAIQGDKADNIPGLPGFGPKRAAQLINEHITVDRILAAAKDDISLLRLTPKLEEAFMANSANLKLAESLIKLSTDVPLDPLRLERLLVPVKVLSEKQPPVADSPEKPDPGEVADPGHAEECHSPETSVPAEPTEPPVPHREESVSDMSIELRPGVFMTPGKFRMLRAMSEKFWESGMYRKFNNAAGCFTVLELGQELGLPPQVAMANFHVIQGRLSPQAHLIIAMAKRHPDCSYLECIEHDSDHATYVTKKKAIGRELPPFTYTIDDAKRDGHAWAKKDGKNLGAMIRKTAGCQASRLWYPEAICGMYAAEELGAEIVEDE